MPVTKRMLRELDTLAEGSLGVVEMESDGVVGEIFGLHADLAQEHPGVNDGGDDNHQEPETGDSYDEAAQGDAFSSSGFVRENQQQA